MTDQEFLKGIIQRDKAVFKVLVDEYQQHVIRTCYALVQDEQDARDLAQEVFIEILDSARSFRGEAKLSSWIYRIAVNKSLNHLKQQKRRRLLTSLGLLSAASGRPDNEAHDIPDPTGADSAVEEREMKEALHYAIGCLSANQKIAFTMHKYDELSYKEIAEVMNVTLSSVESLIHRAKLNLRRTLSDYYKGKQ